MDNGWLMLIHRNNGDKMRVKRHTQSESENRQQA